MLGAAYVWSLGPESVGLQRELTEGLFFSGDSYQAGWLTADQNADGILDYAMKIEDTGAKLLEAIDFNGDGFMDDFYIYARGVLVRREIDQNFDKRIDLWVYLRDGVYVQGYERDSSGDGKIDSYKVFGE